VPVGDETGADAHRAAPLAPDGRGDRLVHPDELRGLDEPDALVAVPAPAAAAQLLLDDLALADQCDPDPEVSRGGERAVNLRVRRAVAAHRVDDDSAGRCGLSHQKALAAPAPKR
jgi:hypothetical protein